MKAPQDLDPREYRYHLPPERIAAHPLDDRSAAKLLVAREGGGALEHRSFQDLPSLLPRGALLVINETRVIHGRLPAQKATGGAAEILCLHPLLPSPDPAVALATRGECTWRCLVGGKNIKVGDTLAVPALPGVRAAVLDRPGAEAVVHFSWSGHETFAELLGRAGQVPLPPYLKREATEADKSRYQTVYAKAEGSVAAPTAGLHFTPEVLADLRARGMGLEAVTLHVGAGTFKPVEALRAGDHDMHGERVSVAVKTLRALQAALGRGEPIVAVGTTSLRTLESLYWLGVKVLRGEESVTSLGQWEWVMLGSSPLPEPAAALAALIALCEREERSAFEAVTHLMIVPGYEFQMPLGLITNFHQPESTLILLVAAFLPRLWRQVYDEALLREYRFLSYGDSSLLLRAQK